MEEQRKILRMRLFTFDCCEERMLSNALDQRTAR